MKAARFALVLAASAGLAACQGDQINPSASSSMSAAEAQENLLTLAPGAALSAAQQSQLASIRGRASTAEVHLARIAAAPGRMLGQGAAVRLAVAPGLNVVAVGERVQQRAAEDISWAGPVRGEHGWVQMVFMDGGVAATVTVGRTQYSIESLGNGLHAVSRIDQSGFPSEHTPDNPSGALSSSLDAAISGIREARSSGGDVGIAALTQINVLVAYTASAATAAGTIGSKIQLAVDETNQSYVNSGININMVRVHTVQVTYNESNRSFSQHVSALQGTTDGLMDNVHTLRNTYAADVVALVVNDSEACGQAAAIKATASSAFMAAHYTCITGYYSFGHEIGHLQGARHDRFVDGSTSPYAYGHGFIPASKSWRTVMAYGNNCSNCTRIQWWSSPLKTYPPTGQVMGTAQYEDNARVLNLTAATVAAFR
ncbi:M12 family metallo-peptidase, partial [Longimicrobium sp.]|uniref:M12 family metallo-peptidase n=1 Tax=Longimicrobium sp. TaxID=2029185 RepID=UPI002F930FC2